MNCTARVHPGYVPSAPKGHSLRCEREIGHAGLHRITFMVHPTGIDSHGVVQEFNDNMTEVSAPERWDASVTDSPQEAEKGQQGLATLREFTLMVMDACARAEGFSDLKFADWYVDTPALIKRGKEMFGGTVAS